MIITNGGAKGNVIPDKAAMEIWVRAPTRDDVSGLANKVEDCIKAAAMATGCQYNLTLQDKIFDNMCNNETLAKLYAKNLQEKGFTEFLEEHNTTGSTDMGNVSYVVPSIHPMFKIGTGEVYHTRDFTSITNTPESHATTLLFAETMSHTCIDILSDPSALEAAKSDFASKTLNL